MAVVKITSKIKKIEKPSTTEEEVLLEAPIDEVSEEKSSEGAPSKKRPCSFCAQKVEPHYYDGATLRRFMNDRGRIVGRLRSSVCSKHQRRVAKEVKRARHLALLPFTVSL